MTIDSRLLAVLETCCTGHVFNTGGADGETGDHIIFTTVAGVPLAQLDNAEPTENARYQIDCYSASAAGASALAEAVKTAMKSAASSRTLINTRTNQTSAFEDGVKLWRKVLEFSVWS
jgi:hypothetical protein